MNALAGDAVLFVAIAAATGFTELRARSALRSIQNDFAKVRSMLALFDARRAALESRKNGGDHLAVNAIDAGSSYETRRLDAKTGPIACNDRAVHFNFVIRITDQNDRTHLNPKKASMNEHPYIIDLSSAQFNRKL